MKTLTKVNKFYLLLCISLTIALFLAIRPLRAEVLTASIIIPPSTVQPDCHTYTGCGVVVVKRHYIYKKCHVRYYPCKRYCHCLSY